MAMPMLPGLDDSLEGEMSLEDPEAPLEAPPEELDAMFANDAAEAFPDLDDAQLTAFQRAVLGLLNRGA